MKKSEIEEIEERANAADHIGIHQCEICGYSFRPKIRIDHCPECNGLMLEFGGSENIFARDALFLIGELQKFQEQLAPCGHLDRWWKVEPDGNSWCVMCALENLNAKNVQIRKTGLSLYDAITSWGANSAGQCLPSEIATACSEFLLTIGNTSNDRQ